MKDLNETLKILLKTNDLVDIVAALQKSLDEDDDNEILIEIWDDGDEINYL
jgi:hypothetical protein